MADNLPNQKPAQLSPKTTAILTLVQGLLPALTAILGGLWIVWTYIDNQGRTGCAGAARERGEDFRGPKTVP
jgi:hypothetical protein